MCSKVREFAAEHGEARYLSFVPQIEEEISELEEDEKQMFLEDLGLKESGLDKLISASYKLLGLISYLTAGETGDAEPGRSPREPRRPQSSRERSIRDFERGFIRAEVVNYQDLLDAGSYAAAREKGLVGLEGKDYVVKDGDVILFRFNV